MINPEELISMPYEQAWESGLTSISAIAEATTKGDISLKFALAAIDKMTRTLDGRTKIKEQQDLKALTDVTGIDFLGTDDQGRRSESEMNETNKAFATGFSTTCLAVALSHPDFGIAAAHFNPFSPDMMRLYLQRGVKNGISLSDLIITNDPDRRNKLVRDVDLATNTARTVNSAITQFRGLTQQKSGLPGGTEIFVIGYEFVTPQRTFQTLRTVQEVVQNAALTQSPILPAITVHSSIGESGGIVYGGKNHPLFSDPSYYPISGAGLYQPR